MMLPTDRIDYSPINDRPKLTLPDGKRLAVWIIVNVEEWNPREPMPRTVLTPPAGGSSSPDIPNWAWHEYGNRVGFWRMLEVLEGLPVALAINGAAIAAYEPIARAALDRGWEFLGHGFDQKNMQKVPGRAQRHSAHNPGDRRLYGHAAARLARPRPDRDVGDAGPAGRGGLFLRVRLGFGRSARASTHPAAPRS